MHVDLSRDVKSKNAIERMYLDDIVNHSWEILPYRRLKARPGLGIRLVAVLE